MEITLPVIPAGILTLLNAFAPYLVAIVNDPRWPAHRKRLVAVIVSVVLTALVLVVYYWYTGDLVPDPIPLLLLSFVVLQAAYTMLWRSAKHVEVNRGNGRDPGD